MDFDLTEKDDTAVLHIEGELDALSTRELNPLIDRLTEEQPTKVLVDFSELRLIDSSGVGTIVALFKTVKAYHGDFAIVGVHDQPLAILRLLGLDRILMGEAPLAAARPYALAAPTTLAASAESGSVRTSPSQAQPICLACMSDGST